MGTGMGHAFVALALAASMLLACEDEATETATGNRHSPTPGSTEAALRDALREASPLDRFQQLSTILAEIDAAESFEEARSVLVAESWWLKTFEVDLLVEAWTRFDPAAALAYAIRIDRTKPNAKSMAAAVQGWALRDPEEAARQVEALIETHQLVRRQLIISLLAGWVHSGEPGVVDYAAALSDRPASNAAIVVAEMTRRLGVPAVLEWADDVLVRSDLPDMLRRHIFLNATGIGGRLDIVAVAAWWAQHQGEPYAEATELTLVSSWLPIDASAAMVWVRESLPADEHKELLSRASAKWLGADYEAAEAWIREAPMDAFYDPMMETYVRLLASRRNPKLAATWPERVLPWADRVHDEKRRLALLEEIVKPWYHRDTRAEEWLEQSPLSEAARNRIRSKPPAKSRLRPKKL